MIDRRCEFIEIDQAGEFVGATRNSPAAESCCNRPAAKIWKFANHNAWLCQEHYDRLVKWMEEDNDEEQP